MSIKKVICASLFLASMPVIAQAGDLTLINNTNSDSTSIINSLFCSNILGAAGITKAHSTNTVPESKVKAACISNPTNCKADVYMTDNCSGTKIGTVTFDTKTGIKSVVSSGGYKISGNGFTFVLDENA